MRFLEAEKLRRTRIPIERVSRHSIISFFSQPPDIDSGNLLNLQNSFFQEKLVTLLACTGSYNLVAVDWLFQRYESAIFFSYHHFRNRDFNLPKVLEISS